jgi:8-oxo-dGTP diphosphatase
VKPTRAVCIILKDNKVLLMHRGNTRDGKDFWVFPGGTVEENEAAENAVIRELEEETSVKATVDRKLYSHDYTTNEQHYFLCKYVSGKPKLGDFNEAKTMQEDPDEIYDPQWVPLKKIPEMLLYPLEIRDWLIEDLKSGFQNDPREETLEVSDLRQSL